MIFKSIVLTILISSSYRFQMSNGWLITRAIDAQKALIAHEEALVDQARTAIKERTDSALNSAKESLMNVAEQINYYVTFPLRISDQVVQQSRGMLSDARSKLLQYISIPRSLHPKPMELNSNEELLNNITFLERIQQQIEDVPGLTIVPNSSPNTTMDETLHDGNANDVSMN
ncbi:uncharacterized protein LOC129725286 [Wyeomyia smithii]|uniref:uncharacterized protein LOC129725286 n=1 Tax=Wyeomyia smithii TaxID=174621 RepID=UPI002467C529|nr:uncharacterized protein LOC129725286 [Wyeomyia smithii]